MPVFLHRIIWWRHSLAEVDGSNEDPQHMFLSRKKTNIFFFIKPFLYLTSCIHVLRFCWQKIERKKARCCGKRGWSVTVLILFKTHTHCCILKTDLKMVSSFPPLKIINAIVNYSAICLSCSSISLKLCKDLRENSIYYDYGSSVFVSFNTALCTATFNSYVTCNTNFGTVQRWS